MTVTVRDLDDLLFMGAEQERAEDRQWLVEQRYRAVLEVLDGAPVSEVAVRYGISRQSVTSVACGPWLLAVAGLQGPRAFPALGRRHRYEKS